MFKRRGFTLIELLVVIAIIALLLSILMPGLQKAKKQAQEVICRSNLHQWGVVFLMYTTDNNDKFWMDAMNPDPDTGVVHQGYWMPMLSELYGNTDKLRVCPSASKPTSPVGGIGTTFTRWGGEIMVNHNFGSDEEKNFGSYGTNLWINSVDISAGIVGWRGQPERQWQTSLVKTSVSTIPMVFDCVWFGTNPTTLFEGTGGLYSDAEDYWVGVDPMSPPTWGNDMARVTLARHGKGIDMTMMDGSTEKVKLHELWTYN